MFLSGCERFVSASVAVTADMSTGKRSFEFCLS